MSPHHRPYDLVYGVPRGAELPPGQPVVDYDLNRLREVSGREVLIAELPGIDRSAHHVLFNVLPHTPMSQVEQDLSAAGRILQPGGTLRVEAHDAKAARRLGKMVRQRFSQVRVERGGVTAYVCAQPRTADTVASNNRTEVRYRDAVTDREFRFVTRPGLFGFRAVDPGTELLVEAMGEVADLNVLDVGCGYGLLGLVAAARGAQVTMIDSDLRAVTLARENLAVHGLEGLVALADGIVDQPSSSFDRVLSNPPTHASSAVLRHLFSEMVRVLKGGTARIVIREHLNYEKWLTALGGVQRIATGRGYKVLEFPSAPS